MYETSTNLCFSERSDLDQNVVPGFSWCPNNVTPTKNSNIPYQNVCINDCENDQIIYNEPPYDKCITKCSNDTRFVDGGDKCIKIPYTRSYAATIYSNNSTDIISNIEQQGSSLANQITKFSTMGGTRSVLIGIAGVVAFFVILSILILLIKAHNLK